MKRSFAMMIVVVAALGCEREKPVKPAPLTSDQKVARWAAEYLDREAAIEGARRASENRSQAANKRAVLEQAYNDLSDKLAKAKQSGESEAEIKVLEAQAAELFSKFNVAKAVEREAISVASEAVDGPYRRGIHAAQYRRDYTPDGEFAAGRLLERDFVAKLEPIDQAVNDAFEVARKRYLASYDATTAANAAFSVRLQEVEKARLVSIAARDTYEAQSKILDGEELRTLYEKHRAAARVHNDIYILRNQAWEKVIEAVTQYEKDLLSVLRLARIPK